MRLAVLSDIHANLVALDAVLDDAKRYQVSEYLVLGDIVDLGPEPGPVVDRIRELASPVVGGNHDRLDERSPVPALDAIRLWSRGSLSSDQQHWLDGLSDELELVLGGRRVWAVHASPGSRTHPVVAATPDDEIAGWLEGRPCDVLCCGHTHVQLLRRVGASTVLNVGSVGMPFREQHAGGPPTIFPWAEYAILDLGGHGTAFELKRVRYDFPEFVRRFRESGFGQAEALLSAWDPAASGCG
ncbi:MAG: metallophosphoesterase family protein [Polyangiaceae bacterium]|nr:metallophosphoesterase family protein [Polyangiaceae bacterium]